MKKYHKEYSPGSFCYQGDYYQLDITKQDKYKIVTVHLIFTLVQLGLMIFAGLRNNPGSRNFFIAVPYAFLFFPTVYLLMTVSSFLKLAQRMESVVYDKAFGRSSRCLAATILITFYITVVDFVWFYRLAQAEKSMEFAYLSAMLLLFIFSWAHRKYLQSWKKKVIICKKEN